MVKLRYDDTVFCFSKGAKTPKAAYYILWILGGILTFVGLLSISIIALTSTYEDYVEEVYALIGCSCFGIIIILFCIGTLLYEELVIKKSIMACINAADAVIRTAFVFEFSAEPISVYRNISKVGVRFRFNDSKIQMFSKKYAILRDYINKECQIVYSPSRNDIVILKATCS